MPLLLAALARSGVRARPAVWDDPSEDWGAFSLVVVRSTWDYITRRPEFVAWARSVPRLANPAPVVGWNTDKRYLADLGGAGLPVADTTWVALGEPAVLPDGPFVVKPTVSSGSQDSARYRGDGSDADQALAHVARLHAAGRTAMVQPYLGAVDTAGESALVYLGGRLSHTVRKGPMLAVGRIPGDVEHQAVGPRPATAAEEAVAERALGAVPGVAGPAGLLYARVDLVPGDDGRPVVLELELTEPSLFLDTDPAAAGRLAAAIAERVATGPP
jgi:glutathione synthase/RimK-type ligase-like ATP-grasp enzyme